MNCACPLRPPLLDAARRCHRARRWRQCRPRHPGQARARCARPWCIGAGDRQSDEVALVSLQDGRSRQRHGRSAPRTPLSRSFARSHRMPCSLPRPMGPPRPGHTYQSSTRTCGACWNPPSHVGWSCRATWPRPWLFAPRWPGSDPDDPGHQCFPLHPARPGRLLSAGATGRGLRVFRSSATASWTTPSPSLTLSPLAGRERSPVADLLTPVLGPARAAA